MPAWHDIAAIRALLEIDRSTLYKKLRDYGIGEGTE